MKKLLYIFLLLPLLTRAQVMTIDFSRAVHHAAGPFLSLSSMSLALVGSFGSGGTPVNLTPTYIGSTKSFSVTGNYKVSLDNGSTYVTSGTVPASGTVLKVQTTSTHPSGSGSGSIAFTGADIGTVTVSITSSVTGTLSFSLTSITANGAAGTAGSPATTTATFAGNTVTGGVAPTGIEYSVNGGSTYLASSQTFSSGSPLGILIRTAASASAQTNSGNIHFTMPGASAVDVAIGGTVSSSTTTPDSVIVYMDSTTGSLGGNSIQMKGDPSAHAGTGHLITGSLAGTTFSASSVSTSGNNWGYTTGTGNAGCMYANDGYASSVFGAPWTAALKEGAFTSNLYQTTYAQVVVSGFKTDGTTYDVSIGSSTVYNNASGGEFNVKGASLQTPKFITANTSNTPNGATAGDTPALWTSVQPDGSGNITIYFGTKDVGQLFAIINYAKFNKH